MPTVPTYDTPQVAPDNRLSIFRFGAPNAPDLAGQSAQQMGRALTSGGGAVGQVTLDAQDQVNQVRVNDAQNQLREVMLQKTYDPNTGYLALKGKAALDPDANGQSMPERYGTDLQTAASDISSQLGNDAQRRAFAQQAQGMQTSFQGDLERHMLGEFTNYSNSVQEGTINLSSQQAMRAWNDPSKIDSAVELVKAAVYQKGQINGWSASQIEAAQLAATSNIHRTVVMSALDNNNPAYALNYLNANKGSMSADDLLRVQGQVNQSAWTSQAQGAVQGAQATVGAQITPNAFTRMVGITLGAESGGKQFAADGVTPLTSPKGAIGVAQVMPATAPEAAKLAGLPWDEERYKNDAEYNMALGKAYLQKQLQDNGGDPAKAWAAYNAGPGALATALQKAGDGGNWLALLPPETQKYVNANMASLSNGGGAGQRPTVMDFVNAAVAKLPAGAPPQAVQMTRTRATQTYNMMTQSFDQQGENAVRTAQQWIAQNQGGFEDMPASLRAAVVQYAPGKLTDLMSYASTFEKDDTQTDMVLYNRLASHPDELAKMTDSQFEMLKNNLSPSDFKSFANTRADLVSGKTDLGASSINNQAVNTVLNNRLEALQIPTSVKPTDLAGKARLGAIQQFVRNSVFDAQAQAGKKFSPVEIEQHIDGLFAQSQQLPGMLWGTNTKPLMSMQYGDIPSADRNALTQAFTARGVQSPTHTDILNAYWRMKAK